jgi:hypothetical protein
VSPYRLAAHLSTAFVTFGGLVWTGLDLLRHNTTPPRLEPETVRHLSKVKGLAVLSAFLVGTTVFSGAFVAGNHAGLAYNTWPKMGDDWVPAFLPAFLPACLPSCLPACLPAFFPYFLLFAGGSYGAVPPAAQCPACPRGRFSSEGASGLSACAACPAGRFGNLTAARAGGALIGGHGAVTGGRVGARARSGKWPPLGTAAALPAARTARAQALLARRLSPQPAPQSDNATQCLQCPAGKYSAEGSSLCEACLPGWFAPPDSASCTNCPGGKFGGALPGADCAECGAGRFR